VANAWHRLFVLEAGMKEIPLTQGQVGWVDDEDYDRVSKYKWCARFRYRTYYAQTRTARSDGRRSLLLHRFVLNAQPGSEIDHIDGNGLNCQKSNLRFVTHQQNMRNMRLRKDSTTGYKGVSYWKKDKKWQARIRVNGEPVYLGCFDDPTKAALAYDEAARKYHGEHAKPNFG
jgi:hypothetical protein